MDGLGAEAGSLGPGQHGPNWSRHVHGDRGSPCVRAECSGGVAHLCLLRSWHFT